MPSVQRYLSGHNNISRAAALTASSVRPAQAVERLWARRSGGGRVRVAGAYTGHEASQIEFEIAAAGGIPRASVPQFVGVGNGKLEVLSVDAAAQLQSLTFTLADLGVPTATARLDAREVQIRARTPGAAGNAIRITVEPHLMRTATPWALLANWPAGTAVQSGVQWDFGALPLSPKGELDEATPRIQFGADSQVYRPWRQYKDGNWQFGLSPALERDVNKGAAVWAVAGGYLVKVTDGVTTETFGDTAVSQPEIRTFYDLLSALATSSLVEVAGVVAADRAVGGQAAVDVPLRTQAWLHAISGIKLDDVGIPAEAPTQNVLVRCVNADVVGSERWSVTGDVSGSLPVATTGQPYVSSAALFTIPAIVSSAAGSGEWSFKYSPVGRDEDEGFPSVCVRPFRFGLNAKARTVTFRYSKRPPADCSCADMPTPRLSLSCLGLGGDMDVDDPEFMSRLTAIYAWRESFVRSNTKFVSAGTTPGTPGVPGVPSETYYMFSLYGWDPDQSQQFVVQSVTHYPSYGDAEAAANTAMTGMVPAGTAKGDQFAINGVPVTMAWFYGGAVNSLASEQPLTRYTTDEVTATGSGGSPGTPGQSYGQRWEAYVRDLDWMERAIDILIDCLNRVYEKPAALPGWDALWTEVKADLAHLQATQLDITKDADGNERYMDRYRATVDNILLSVGILPKSESSSTDAGGCWTDYGGTHWWVDVDGYYLPAFTNKPYISARRDTTTGKTFSTMEFGFGLVVACEERLKEGDELQIRISQVDAEKPYQVGDEAVIATISAGPAWLTGGVDGTDVQTWRAVGSTSGQLPDYMVPTDGTATPVWSNAGIDVLLALGGIPFVLGDAFSLAIEAGQYRWRRDNSGVLGPWSALLDIPPSGPAPLVDGLDVYFDAGAAPSFVPGDAYGFQVHQPWAVSHVRDASTSVWGWDGANADLVLDLGAVRQLDAVALARYSLPAGAQVAVELSDDGATWSAPLAMDVSGLVSVQFLPGGTARYMRLTVSNAASGSIGWVWAGQPLATDHHSSSCKRKRRWSVQRADGINATGLYAGAGDGWSLGWQPGDASSSRLLEGDVERLLELLNWSQQTDEPLLFVPHYLHPEDASLVRFSADALEVADMHEWQPNSADDRILSATLELEPVYA